LAILDEFVAVTSYARNYAILCTTVLRGAAGANPTGMAGAVRREPQKALAIASTAANQLASERLVLFHPELVPMLQWRGASC
jgi:hypothetical protein